MTGLALLRMLAFDACGERSCHALHLIHGDDGTGCGGRDCLECKSKALSIIADRIAREAVRERDDISRRDADALAWVEDNGGLESVKRRLMPEGMEWPRYENGEPVKPGSWLQDNDGEAFEAVSFVFTCDWWGIHGYRPDRYGTIGTKYRRQLDGMAYGTHVKRPAVLAADGEPLRVGETVWDTETGEQMHVCGFENGYVITDSQTWGDTRITPSVLTHERPDSWERIEQDAKLAPGDYIEKHGRKTDLYAYEEMPIDLVRRCKALAKAGK